MNPGSILSQQTRNKIVGLIMRMNYQDQILPTLSKKWTDLCLRSLIMETGFQPG